MLKTMSRKQYETGQPLQGYLYNASLNRYAAVDADNKWVYASSVYTSGAILLTIQRNFNDDFMARTNIAGTEYYLGWRNSTGAVKLYDTYESMNLRNWTGNDLQFRIYSYQQGQYMGTKSSDDNELYYRASVYHDLFEFHVVQFAAFESNEEMATSWKNYTEAYFERCIEIAVEGKESADPDDEKLTRIPKNLERENEKLRSLIKYLNG